MTLTRRMMYNPGEHLVAKEPPEASPSKRMTYNQWEHLVAEELPKTSASTGSTCCVSRIFICIHDNYWRIYVRSTKQHWCSNLPSDWWRHHEQSWRARVIYLVQSYHLIGCQQCEVLCTALLKNDVYLCLFRDDFYESHNNPILIRGFKLHNNLVFIHPAK